jgi:hypothetical protein
MRVVATTSRPLLKLSMAAVGLAGMGSFAFASVGVGQAGGSVTHVAKSKAKTTKPAKKKASGCSSYHAGSKGVTQTFCTGKAVVKITVGTATTTIKGGTCAVSGAFFTVNAGVVVGLTFKGTKPNYFGMDAPQASGAFSNATLAYVVGGTSGLLTKNSGDTNHKTGTFTGTDLSGNAVSGTFTC